MKRIKDCMSKNVISIKRSTSLKELLNLFKDFHRFPLVPVVDEENRLVGIVTLENLIQVFHPPRYRLLKTIPFLEHREEIFEVDLPAEVGSLLLAEDIMNRHFLSIHEDEEIENAYKIMRLHKVEFLPVVDREGKLTGMIGIFDIIRNLLKEKGVF
jgi:CBS domain-containing protein